MWQPTQSGPAPRGPKPGLDGKPAPIVVREPETLAPKPGSEHTVLLSQVVNHILLLAVDPASHNEQ